MIRYVHLVPHHFCILQENLRQKVVEDVVEILLRRIVNTEQVIDRVDARLIALKIAVKLEFYGIIFDEEKFLQVVALNPTLMGVTGSVRKLLPPVEEKDDNDSITSDTDDLFDMFYMVRPDHNERGVSLASRRTVSSVTSIPSRSHGLYGFH